MKRKTIISNFSRNAHVYDRYASIQVMCAHHLLGYIQQSNPQSILDLCCGTATFTGLLVDKYPQAQIKAIDISAAMIEVARTKVKTASVVFAVDDAQTITSDQPYNLITANAGLQWLEDIKQALQQYYALLDNRGELTFSLFGPKTFEQLQTILMKLFDKNAMISAAQFPTITDVKKCAHLVFDAVTVQRKIYTEEYSCVTDLLRKIKYSGVGGNGIGQGRVWTKGTVSKLQDMYLEQFGKIEATYEVAFFRCIKE